MWIDDHSLTLCNLFSSMPKILLPVGGNPACSTEFYTLSLKF